MLDLVLGQARGRGDGDRLLEAGLEILRADRHDAVGRDLERHLDLDLALRRAPQAGQHELAEQLVLLGAIALALQHEDLHRGLVVLDRREDVRRAASAPSCSAGSAYGSSRRRS